MPVFRRMDGFAMWYFGSGLPKVLTAMCQYGKVYPAKMTFLRAQTVIFRCTKDADGSYFCQSEHSNNTVSSCATHTCQNNGTCVAENVRGTTESTSNLCLYLFREMSNARVSLVILEITVRQMKMNVKKTSVRMAHLVRIWLEATNASAWKDFWVGKVWHLQIIIKFL